MAPPLALSPLSCVARSRRRSRRLLTPPPRPTEPRCWGNGRGGGFWSAGRSPRALLQQLADVICVRGPKELLGGSPALACPANMSRQAEHLA
jgi:hypothetical protein